MKAMVVPRFGGPEVFELQELPTPEPGPGEVTIDVDFAGVNFTDIRNRRGDGAGSPPMVVGVEAAGRIRALGEGVTGFEVGQPVCALTGGHSYAEVATANAQRVYALPDVLVGDPVSGGVSVVAPFSLLLLRVAARIRPDEVVLLHGAAGGVGATVAQVARELGLGVVYGTVGTPEKIAYARQYPFADVFPRDTFVEAVHESTGGRGVDVVLDPMGGETRRRSIDILAPFGRLVHFGNASAEPEVAPAALEMRSRGLGYVGYSSAGHMFRDPVGVRPHAEEAIAMVADGRVRIDVTDVRPLEEAAIVHELLGSGRATGKFVLSVGG